MQKQMSVQGQEPQLSLLDHFEKIVELSEKKGFTQVFWEKAKTHLEITSKKLRVTSQQAALFAHMLNRCDDDSITIEDLATSLHCSRIKMLCYMGDFDALEKNKLLRCRRPVSAYHGRENGIPSYRVPICVLNAIRTGSTINAKRKEKLSLEQFFAEVGDLFYQRTEGEISYLNLVTELQDLIKDNLHLSIAQQIRLHDMEYESAVLLIRFCELLVNENDDNICTYQLEDIFSSKPEFQEIEGSLKEGCHPLQEHDLVEFANADGYNDTEHFHLTDKAKQEYLEEFSLKHKNGKRGNDFLLVKDIVEKKLFYNNQEKVQIQKLTTLLGDESFSLIQSRLKERGLRGGFACLFYGGPGTGKTETVYQIARETGRDILPVSISDTKSKWFGDSEKAVKQIFDRYRGVVKAGGKAPILLFNEADAIIGKRTEIGDRNASIDKTLNAIQNILLQEIENLEGILIAATNFETNMDSAFERRFLYKIKFEKPALTARHSIWRSIIPELSESDAHTLATRFDFSGGQIENIARKRMVETVLSGEEPSLQTLIGHCDAELLAKQAGQIGFGG